MSWITGLAGCLSGICLSCLGTLWAAHQFQSFNTYVLIIAGLLPLFGFLAGFIPVAKLQHHWPVREIGARILIGLICAMGCAVAAFVSFAAVSHMWNKNDLPPEKNLVYLLAHPTEVPSLKVTTTKNGIATGERDDNWYLLAGICFFVGAGCAYGWTGRGN